MKYCFCGSNAVFLQIQIHPLLVQFGHLFNDSLSLHSYSKDPLCVYNVTS
jgi:hypothetical protein